MHNSSSSINDTLVEMIRSSSSNFKTPCYVYSVSEVRRNYQDLKNALGTELIYSLKSNSNIDLIVRCGDVFDDGIEIASINELNLIAGGESTKYINNPSADKNFIRAAVSSKATTVIDHIEQLEIVAELSQRRKVNPVVFRVNPSVLKKFDFEHPSVRNDHFGMDWNQLVRSIKRANELELNIAGFHLFKGSYSFNKTAIATAKSSLSMLHAVQQVMEREVEFLNLGGGFSEDWRAASFDFEHYRELLSEFPASIRLAHEAGRGIMASAGFFVTRVRYIKSILDEKDNQTEYAICDGGIAQNFLLAQTENTFRKLRQPQMISLQEQDVELESDCYLVGSSCSKDDVIGQLKQGANKPQIGEYAVFDSCGAYNSSYTVSPFLKLPQANAYIIE